MINNIAKINPKLMKWARIRAGYVGEYENRLPKRLKLIINYGNREKEILHGIN